MNRSDISGLVVGRSLALGSGVVTLLLSTVLACSSNEAPAGAATGGSSSSGHGGGSNTAGSAAAAGAPEQTPGTAGSSAAGTGGVSVGGAGTTAGVSGDGNNAGTTSGAGRGGDGGVSGSAGVGGSAGTGGMANAGGMAGGAVGSLGPPMGWASWNSFEAKINYKVIKDQADSLVASGLKAAGYEYVNIDEGWWQGTRDASGDISIDSSEWPGGMKAIADYIHGLGLKAGIYTDAGKDGCGYYFPSGRPAAPGSGSEGNYVRDFLAFSKWGFDFVKVDWCGGDKEHLDAKTAYQAIADAIKQATAQTGRPMVLSVCNWGNQSPWSWAPGISTMWRTSQDIVYYGSAPEMSKVLANFDSAQHAAAQTPGHYNDPDMLVVGMQGFSAAQNRTHMALWAISSAPLLAGNKLDSLSADTKSVLTNGEVLAIDQDPLAKQASKVSDEGGRQVYSKVLSGTGRRAVLLLNRGSSMATLTVRFADIGLGAMAKVRNVWTATDLPSQTTSYSTSVPAQDSVLLTVTEGT